MKSDGESMAEGLKKILSGLAVLGTAPDADMEFLTKLQLVIQQKVKEASTPASQGGPQPPLGSMPGGMPGMGAPGMGAPGGMGGMPGGPQPPPPGLPPGGGPGNGPMMLPPMSGLGAGPGAEMPNMDEMRRLIGAQGNG